MVPLKKKMIFFTGLVLDGKCSKPLSEEDSDFNSIWMSLSIQFMKRRAAALLNHAETKGPSPKIG